MYEKVIEIDMWSSYGCFNKSFSNKGGLLTYPIPPKTAIIGMIGAVLGIDFDDYEEFNNKKVYSIEKFYNIQISVQALFDLKTARLVYNNCDKSIANIYQDILVNPKYKVFISFPNELSQYENEFIKKMKNHSTIYNLYMGRNEFPLNYEYIREFSRCDKNFSDDDEELDEVKLIGFLTRSKIEDVNINKTNKFSSTITSSKPFFEYLINDYPIKRYNFTNFQYEFISFYPQLQGTDSFFKDIELKEGCEITLTAIGDNKWICLI